MKTFVILLIVSMNALSANATVIEFTNTSEDNLVIQVLKTDSDRVFNICTKNPVDESLSSCSEINRVSVRTIDGNEEDLPGGFFEVVPETIGTIGGFIVGYVGGAFAGIVFSDGSVVAPKNTLAGNLRGGTAFVVVLGLGTWAGYSLGDSLDGQEFSKMEAAALRMTILDEEILSPVANNSIALDTSIETFRSYLQIAIEAVEERD